MSTLINLCPHDMHVYGLDTPDQIDPAEHTPIRVYPASGDIARTATTELGQFLLSDELVIVVDHTGTTGLPAYAGHMDSRDREVWYIVSLPTALSARRDDLLVPYAPVRNMQGQVVGCRMFAKPC